MTRRQKGEPSEPTLHEILCGAVTQQIMRAAGVDAEHVEKVLADAKRRRERAPDDGA